MLTKSQLLSFKADSYRPVIESWGQAADAVSSASNTISSTGDQMYNWTGPAAEQAVTTMGDLVSVVVNAPQLLNEAQDTLGVFVAAVLQQQQILTEAVKKASSLNCTVEDDGTVIAPPQPPGEPPQECPPDPTLAAKWAHEQEAYNQSPAVQTWQAAIQHAPGLQTSIQGALQAATAADGRAERDLQAGIQGGTDVAKIVTGQDPTGSYLGNLYADTQSMADGHRWMEQYVDQVAALLPRAANGDKAAAAQLSQLAPLSWDQDFGASLMNQLGPAGLERLPVDMGERAQAGMTDPADHAILQFLGNSLASASNSPSLSPGFIQALKNDQTAQYDYTLVLQTHADHGPQTETEHHSGPAGLWALGQILGASNGAVQYNPQFLTTVGSAIINSDKAFGIEDPGPFTGTNDFNNSGGDPVYGLMQAAQVSPLAAQALFTSGQNLNNLLDLPWNVDKGSALGSALQSATAGPPTLTTNTLTANLVRDLAAHYGTDSSYESQTSGLNAHVARILSQFQDLAAIEWNANNSTGFGGPQTLYNRPAPGSSVGYYGLPPVEGPVFDQADLAVVLGSISQTPAAYRTLCTAAHQYAQIGLAQAVNQAMKEHGGIQSQNGYQDIQPAFQGGTTMLAFLAKARSVVGQSEANAMAANLQKEYTDISAGLNIAWAVAGAIPEVGQYIGAIPGVIGGIYSIKAANVSASNASTVKGAQAQSQLAGVSTWDLANALLRADPGLVANQDLSFLGKDGHLLPYTELVGEGGAGIGPITEWLDDLRYGDGGAGANYNQLVNSPIYFGAQAGQQGTNAGGVTTP